VKKRRPSLRVESGSSRIFTPPKRAGLQHIEAKEEKNRFGERKQERKKDDPPSWGRTSDSIQGGGGGEKKSISLKEKERD